MTPPTELQAEDIDLVAAGHRLRARRLTHPLGSRKNGGPVLVFLHEGLGCIELWRGFPAALVEVTGLDGLIYDRWGHGKADPLTVRRPHRYLHDEAFDSLPEVLQECGVKEAILIGHSDGGTIALLYGARYRQGLRAIITEAAHVFVEEVTLVGIRETVKQYQSGDLKERLSRYHDDNTETLFRAWADTWLDPGFRDWNVESYLPQVMSPLLVIQGEDDEYATRAQVDAIVGQVSGPVRPLLVPRCGHTPHREAQDLVLQEMAAFIETVR
ncbi:MAG TPA: alpha/beta hydrolase [Syntrophobacteria bacterium]|nr:alpha/beta hydrolase [Syntrophobacteria bacterium]